MRELDPEEARAVIDPVLQLMIDAVHRFDGYVVQSAGDGIFALFGAPVAHEDHPQRAVHAAIAMRDELRHRASDPTSRAAVDVRIGINTGEVVLRLVHTGGHTEYTPVGHAANLAARMQSAAQGGTIVVSENTRRLVEGYFEVHELGPTPVKGIGEAINLAEVLGARPLHGHFELARQRGLTKFVGRENELKQMTRALELALDRHGQIVAVVAEAGTGKSRLFHEFKATIPTECKLLEAYSVSHGKASAWLPVLELLRGYFGIGDSDDAASRRAKVRSALAALDPVLEGALPYLLGLLGIIEGADPLAQMDPHIKRQRTLDEINRILLRETIKQPLVVIFEDLHWVDDHSQALLYSLADRIGSSRVLLLVNYRPEYHHNWGSKSCYSQLRLDALGRESAQEMLDALLPMPISSSENLLACSVEGEGPVSGESADLTALKRLVIERTGGNPFFIEEMVQALFEDGGLVRNGAVKVTRSLSALRLPPTVQGILASRIDRLSAAHKNLLQTMAVIGRGAQLGVLRRVVRVETELEDDLRVLRAGEFVYEQPTTNDVEYVFKHALTQEVAYNSLLMEQRKRLHERAGAAIESLYGMQLDDYLSELARHYRYSGNTGKALEYLQRAGAQAMARSSYEEAITLFSAALELLKILPDRSERIQQELALQLDLGSALSPVKGWAAPEVGQVFDRASELCRQLGNTPQFSAVLSGLYGFYVIRGEVRRAHELAQQILAIAASGRDENNLMWPHYFLGSDLLWMGEFSAARGYLERNISLYDRALRGSYSATYAVFDPGVASLYWTACALCIMGYPDQAVKRSRQALALARELSHPFSLATALSLSAKLQHLRRDAEASFKLADQSLHVSNELGFKAWAAASKSERGCALIELGRVDEGIVELQQGISETRARGAELGIAPFLAGLSNGYRQAGRVEDGLTAVAEGLAVSKRTGDCWFDAELHRLRGELLLKRGAHAGSNVGDEACASFRQALEIARGQNAKWWELRATTSLARLLARQGQGDEARAILAEIYNWFTEGFDTADLKEAKALLEELK